MLHASVSANTQSCISGNIILSRNTPKLPIEKLVVLFQNMFSVMFGIPWFLVNLLSSDVLGMF